MLVFTIPIPAKVFFTNSRQVTGVGMDAADDGWLSDPSGVIREGSVVSVPSLGVSCVY